MIPIFWWLARSGSLAPRWPRTVGALTRTTTTTAPDSAGVSRTLAPHQPAWSALDLEGDAARETMALALRSAGSERVAWAWHAPPRAMTLYCRFVERTALATANPLLLLGAAGAGARLAISRAASGQYTLLHHNGATSTTATAGAARVTDAVHELRAVLRATGEVQLYQYVAGAGGTTGGPSAGAPALAAAWSATALTANVADAGTSGGADWLTLAVLPGEADLVTCRATW